MVRRSINISKRGLNTPASPIRKLSPLAAQAKRKGHRVYHLNIGQPDIPSPPEFFEGLRLFHDPVVAYEPSQGSPSLCRAWSAYMNEQLVLTTEPEQFLITSGASEGLLYSFMVACDPGEEILVFDPTYANYISFALSAGVKVVAVPAKLEQNFALPSRAEIEAAITTKTRAIVVCNPNNPTGSVYDRAELELLLAICAERDLFLIADETYREFVYDGRAYLSVLNIDPANERVILIDSLSKRFSLCGARIGCLVTSNQEFYDAVLRFAQARLSSPSAEQFAAAYMLENISADFTMRARDEYQGRRDTLYDALSAIPGVSASKPQGAFYAVVELPVDDAEEFATFLLRDFHLHGKTTFIAPAAGFYVTPGYGKREARIAYVLNKHDIQAAVECLAAGLAEYK